MTKYHVDAETKNNLTNAIYLIHNFKLTKIILKPQFLLSDPVYCYSIAHLKIGTSSYDKEECITKNITIF